MSTNSADNDSEDCLSQAEAARLLGISRQAVHKLIQAGRLTPISVGGRAFVRRSELERMGRLKPGRPAHGRSALLDRLRGLIDRQPPQVRRALLEHLQTGIPTRPIEVELGAPASLILEALELSGDLTKRMLRGVIAEGAFKLHVVDQGKGWQSDPVGSGLPFDFSLTDQAGKIIRVQVKLQRSERGIPVVTASDHFLVETQRTRGGTTRQTDEKTRPYRFGDFDILAVSVKPATGDWGDFRYTVANWLLPDPIDPRMIATLQPVARSADDCWTDRFEECVSRLTSGVKKAIAGQTRKLRKE